MSQIQNLRRLPLRPVDDVTDAVVLVPGFFAFDRIGAFYYFADRTCGALRAALETRLGGGRRVPVLPCAIHPGAELAVREKELLDVLDTVGSRYPRARLHLVGHSAGGVTVQLLAGAASLSGGAWDARAEEIRRRLTSIVSLCAPHWGSCFAQSAVAMFVRQPTAPGFFASLGPLSNLAASFFKESAMSAVFGSPRTAVDAARVLRRFLVDRNMVLDLQPARMAELRARSKVALPVRFRSFVAVANAAAVDGEADPLFRDLYHLTERFAEGPSPSAIGRAVELLNRRRDQVIKSPDVPTPTFDERANDGLVNAARQIVDPDDPDELAGVVVADHADVMGHYDRVDEITQEPIRQGLFHSGSTFRDDQFFTLYARIADEIIAAAEARASDRREAPPFAA